MENMDAITEQKVYAVFQNLHAIIESSIPRSNYLLEGKLGLVLYYFSLYEAFGEMDHANKCIELLEEVMNQEDEEPAPLSGTGFANGTAGLGFLLFLLQKKGLIDIDLQEELKELDESLTTQALRQIEEERNDYLHGAMGIIHYFLTRIDEEDMRKRVELLVTAFCSKAVLQKEGVWFRNFIIDAKEKERIDLSLSHGNAGFLLLLLNVLETGILEQGIKDIIEKGIGFIISQQMEPNPAQGQYAVFPFSVHSRNRTDQFFSQRLAWCYGDLNIVLLLYRAAAQLEQPGWKEMADHIAEQTIQRTGPGSTLAEDSHFCHGTSGLAQFYKRLFAITGDKKFSEAADHWIGQTVSNAETEWKKNKYTGKECSILSGLPGINLVLLSCISKNELTWSRSLLL
ncbi:MAG TPA: lanthionine synthetase LanC family protein [Chitinophagaceae bacterium]|jgi:lantibiotic modifying enzyme|nr:lanthionine synthetase LanC family protein [Chitinophagaceae bacterium]